MMKVSTELVKKEVEVLHQTTSEYALRQSGGCFADTKSSQCSSTPARRLAMKSVISPGTCGATTAMPAETGDTALARPQTSQLFGGTGV